MKRRLCMSDEEHAAYVRANHVVSGSHKVKDPCADCLQAFSIEMREAGLCDGRPGVKPGRRPAATPTLMQQWREASRRYRQRHRGVAA